MKTPALTVLILVLSFFGIADSWYLTQSAYTGAPLTCDLTGLDGCNIVAQSAYSHLLGFPLALYGLFFFGFLFVLSALALAAPRRIVYLGLYALGSLGFVASLVFIGIQLLLIKAICIYCFASALISFFTFACAYVIWRRQRSAPSVTVVLPPVLP